MAFDSSIVNITIDTLIAFSKNKLANVLANAKYALKQVKEKSDNYEIADTYVNAGKCFILAANMKTYIGERRTTPVRKQKNRLFITAKT